MVNVPKHNSDVRVCVDYTQLNKSINRERSILPSVNEILRQLQGVNYFPK